MIRTVLLTALFGLFSLAVSPSAAAQDLVYEPTNPAFGGSYLNYQWLLQSAQTQNAFEDSGRDAFGFNPLDDFEQSLQRQILNQLSRELVADRFGDIDLTREGSYDLGEFTVDVTPGASGIQIRVFDVTTGDETTITIPRL